MAERAEKSKALVNDGMTQREAAEVLGVSVGTVNSDICSENKTYTIKTEHKPRQKQIQYKINSGTKPQTAAEKIIGKFGVEFSMDLENKLGIAEVAKSVEALNPAKGNQYSAGYKKENITSKRGTSKEYRIAKLKRDYQTGKHCGLYSRQYFVK